MKKRIYTISGKRIVETNHENELRDDEIRVQGNFNSTTGVQRIIVSTKDGSITSGGSGNDRVMIYCGSTNSAAQQGTLFIKNDDGSVNIPAANNIFFMGRYNDLSTAVPTTGKLYTGSTTEADKGIFDKYLETTGEASSIDLSVVLGNFFEIPTGDTSSNPAYPTGNLPIITGVLGGGSYTDNRGTIYTPTDKTATIAACSNLMFMTVSQSAGDSFFIIGTDSKTLKVNII